MATLEKIRSKGGVLVAIAVGLALFAFIMMDFMSSGGSMFSGNQTEVANINGTSINIQDFQNKVSEMEEFNKLNQGNSALSEEEVYRLREQTWTQLVNQTLLEEQYEEIGLNVTSDELMDMVTGKNIHPAIQQHPLFANQQTGAFDKQQVVNFLLSKNQDPTAYFYWMVMEEQLMNERLFNKYSALLKKGMYVPQMWKDSEIAARSQKADFDFVVARFTSIPDSAVNVSDSEIKDYYNKNTHLFEQAASRDIEYITFNIEPTEADRQTTSEWITDMLQDFGSAEVDPIQFVNLNSDEPFSGRNQRPAEFSSQIAAFVTNAEVGDVYGPYLEDNSFKASRLVAINNLPDSVRARHLLIRSTSMEETNKLADSLLNLARNGADFADLARRHSEDQGSAINGGDLGWFGEGMMVKPFNDAAFNGKAGDIEKVETQFGVHILHIQQQSNPSPKYQIATLAREITHSSKTYQDIYSKATKFAAMNGTPEKFNQAVEEENLTKRFGRSIGKNDRSVGGLESSRELVRWAYEAKVGELSPVFEFDDRFVFAHLIAANEEGIRSLEVAQSQIERELIADKKAEKLLAQMKEKIESGADLETIAQQMNSTVQSAQNITFASFQVPGAGVEPALVAAAVNTPANQISKPVKGSNGVYVLKVNNIETIEVSPENVTNELNQNLTMKIDYQLVESMRENAEIVDRRAQFY
jgi:peptidyl-prolyl cis-trans isomerase D